MRARRISEGERRQADVVQGDREPMWKPNIGEATDEPREGAEVPEGHVGFINDDDTAGSVERMCTTCTKAEADGNVVVAPTGTGHLTQDGQKTLCGRDCSDW